MSNGLGHPEAREGLFGGKGKVLVRDLLGQAGLPPFTAVLACELAPGGSVGTHRQQEFPEVLVVTDGEGSAELDGVPTAIGAGSLIALPLGSTLALSNGSNSQPLRYIIVKARHSEA
jgi:quercetin dioxygenase-like cupin family protein